MKKRLFALLLVVFIATAAALPVYADIGPKQSIDLIVKNAPDEDYYIDLLQNEYNRAHDESRKEHVEKNYSGAERDMMMTLVDFEDNGWTPRFGSPISQEFTRCNSNGKYIFDYMDVPYDFRVVIVTVSGKVITSDVFTRKSYNAVITYDVETGEFHEDMSGALVKQLISIFLTFLATILVEGIIFSLFKYKFDEGKNFIVFILTNLATQVVLYIASCYLFQVLIAAELVVTVIEAIVYSRLLTPKEKAVRYALSANIISALLTLPVWAVVKLIIRI